MSSLLGALGVSALGSLFGSGVNLGTQAIGNRRQLKYQKQMADYEYDKNMQMWNTQNAYNAPSAQMDRLKAAGLNPNMVYGTGAVANSASQIPQYQSQRVDYNLDAGFDPVRTLGAYQDFRMKSAQISNVTKQNDLLQEQVRAAAADADRKEMDLAIDRSPSFKLPHNLGSSFGEDDSVWNENFDEPYKRGRLARYSSDYFDAQSKDVANIVSRRTMDSLVSQASTTLSNLRKQGNLTDKEIAHEVQKIISLRLENELREKGVTSSDHILLRLAARIFEKIFPGFAK